MHKLGTYLSLCSLLLTQLSGATPTAHLNFGNIRQQRPLIFEIERCIPSSPDEGMNGVVERACRRHSSAVEMRCPPEQTRKERVAWTTLGASTRCVGSGASLSGAPHCDNLNAPIVHRESGASLLVRPSTRMTGVPPSRILHSIGPHAASSTASAGRCPLASRLTQVRVRSCCLGTNESKMRATAFRASQYASRARRQLFPSTTHPTSQPPRSSAPDHSRAPPLTPQAQVDTYQRLAGVDVEHIASARQSGRSQLLHVLQRGKSSPPRLCINSDLTPASCTRVPAPVHGRRRVAQRPYAAASYYQQQHGDRVADLEHPPPTRSAGSQMPLRGDHRQARVASRRCVFATEGIERELGNARRTRAPGTRMRVAEDEEEKCASACGCKECQGAARRRCEEGGMYMQRDLLLRGGVRHDDPARREAVPVLSRVSGLQWDLARSQKGFEGRVRDRRFISLELNVEHSSLTRKNWDCERWRENGQCPRSKYVSSAMKIVVLREMTVICNSQDNVETMADILSSYDLDFLLESRNEEVQGWTCRLLGSLARECPNRTDTWAASVYKQLASLLQVAELLESPNTAIRVRMCELLTELKYHQPTVPGVSGANVCEQLVFLLRLPVIEWETYALYCITKLPEGMQAALEANLRDHVTELFESPSQSQPTAACWPPLSGGCTANSWYQFCRYPEWTSAIEALRWISKSPDGPGAVVEANIMDLVNNLLDSYFDVVRVLLLLGCTGKNDFIRGGKSARYPLNNRLKPRR
ncbi:hypothetical protein DFH09DRAFT_1097062 [Mycena vulgaris]|nr:hypothetical protein DFH09DRAFT_1097062 [Mycena vulgaris]